MLHQELLQRRSTRNVLPAMDEGETVQEGGTTGSIGFQINLQNKEMSVKHVSLILMAEAFVPTFPGVILHLMIVLCLCHNASTLLHNSLHCQATRHSYTRSYCTLQHPWVMEHLDPGPCSYKWSRRCWIGQDRVLES